MSSNALSDKDSKRILPEWTRSCNKKILKEFDLSPKFGVYCLPVGYGEDCREFLVRHNEPKPTWPAGEWPHPITWSRNTSRTRSESEGVPPLVPHCIVKKKREDPVIRWTRNKKGQVDMTPKKKPSSKELFPFPTRLNSKTREANARKP